MNPDRRKKCASVGNKIAHLLAAALLAAPSLSFSEPGAISFEDCEIDGFGLGGSADLMRSVFGDPEHISIAKSPLSEYSHREYEFDGLRIVFSTSGRSAMHYTVTSSNYRLSGGIGVGSNWTDILAELGPGGWYSSEGRYYYNYRVFNTRGDPTPAILTFTLDADAVVTQFSVETQ